MTGISILLVAAMLEIGGDAAMRRGLVERAWPWLGAGAVSLALYGLVVNLDDGRIRSIDGGVHRGLLVVSQVVAYLLFGGRPSSSILCGGVLIVVGGGSDPTG
ncbi:MAG: hypothetical protein ACREQL_01375 [Candidatus Binatia bacterium]